MLKFDSGRVRTSDNLKVHSAAVIPAEGCALVADYEGGALVVKPSTGASGEKFVGVSIAETMNQALLPFIDQLQSAAEGNTVTLTNRPQAGTLLVEVVEANGSRTKLTSGAPASGNNQYSLANDVITFHAEDHQGKVFVVAYRYSPTVLQLREIQGDQAPGQTAMATLSVVGAIQEGVVETSEFDTTVQWDGSVDVKLGANGRFTQGGSGVTVPAIITKVPSAGSPFLGLMFK